MSEAVVVVSYRLLPGTVDVARREIAALVATVLATEPDCRGIDLLQDLNDPTRFTLIERWPDQGTFLGLHMQQPHIQSFIQRAGAFLAGPPEISFWHAVGAA
jgi:quinol monooxygenase YgiN